MSPCARGLTQPSKKRNRLAASPCTIFSMSSTGYGRRWRLNWMFRWGGLAVCALVAGVWVASHYWQAYWWLPRRLVVIERGSIVCFGQLMRDALQDLVDLQLSRSGAYPYKATSGFEVSHAQVLHYCRPVTSWRPHWNSTFWSLPLGNAFLLAVAPTALFWRSELRRRHRERINHCFKCGYNLTGLADGAACPECGQGRAADGA